MERLARLVEQLRASVEAFKLRDNQAYTVPTTSGKLSLDDEPENPLTVSGVFRTVSATARTVKTAAPPPAPATTTANTMLPPQSEDPFAFYPKTPNQYHPDTSWEWSDQPQPQGEEDKTNQIK
jgi:hypothetical protein